MSPALFGRVLVGTVALTLAGRAAAHDIWLECNRNLLPTGEWVGLNLMLGNHGNHHRDFRLASKVPAGQQSLRVVMPGGRSLDLTSSLTDNGYEPKEGFWSTSFSTERPGIYTAVSTFDQVMSFAPVRDIKCAKTYFAATKSTDRPKRSDVGFSRPIGAPLELVPISNPVFGLGAGSSFSVKVLRDGKPLPGTVVSFIPKGVELKGDIDPNYEVKTDAKGIAKLTLNQAGPWLIASHVKDDTAKGTGYESIGYSATLWLSVPNQCPCCVATPSPKSKPKGGKAR